MRPRQGAAAAILDDHGRLLLVKENYDRRRWSLPGGAVEPTETPLEAVIREAREETGLAVRVEHVVGVYRLDNGFTATLLGCSLASGEPVGPERGDRRSRLVPSRRDSGADQQPAPPHAADIVAGCRGVFRDDLPRMN